MSRSYIHYAATVNSLGHDRARCLDNLIHQRIAPSMRTVDHLHEPVTFPYFRLADPPELSGRSDRLLCWLRRMLRDALEAHPLSDAVRSRTGLFLASSSVGVESSEIIYREQLRNDPDTAIPVPNIAYNSLAETLAKEFGLSPFAYTVVTACTSAANALLFAHAMLLAGRIEQAIVIGFEMFNETSALGFLGLELISPSGTVLPFDARRNGMVLGEGIGLLVLSRTAAPGCIALLGGASNTDTYGPTTANPDGSSIEKVMQAALQQAGAAPEDVRAVKLHGTASLMNDESEARGLHRLFARPVPVFVLKPFIGHTLGACAAIETVLTVFALQEGFIPATTGIGAGSDAFGLTLNQRQIPAESGLHLLNYFAFGGNNTTLVLEKP